MTEHEASRTLVKSPPELWEECSDARSLARHLGQFGEIRITRREPESAVAWEGQGVSGTVRLEPSGWGTRVTLTASPEHEEVVPEEPAADDPIPEPADADQAPHEAETSPDLESAPPEHDPAPVGLSTSQWAKRARLLERVTALFFSRGAEVPEPPRAEPPEPAVEEPSEPAVEEVPAPAVEEVLEPASTAPPEPVAPEPPEPLTELSTSEEALSDLDPGVALTAALDSLGQAHHRPFSRA
jgi:hypothetical protein